MRPRHRGSAPRLSTVLEQIALAAMTHNYARAMSSRMRTGSPLIHSTGSPLSCVRTPSACGRPYSNNNAAQHRRMLLTDAHGGLVAVQHGSCAETSAKRCAAVLLLLYSAESTHENGPCASRKARIH
jgi:hypothetical protein